MRTKLVIAAVATAAAVSAVGASAYTESISNVDSNKVIGYAATHIDGATFDAAPTFVYSTNHDQVTEIDVLLSGDTHASTLSVSRNGAAPVACTTGSYDSQNDNTPYTCSSLSFAVAAMTSISYSLS